MFNFIGQIIINKELLTISNKTSQLISGWVKSGLIFLYNCITQDFIGVFSQLVELLVWGSKEIFCPDFCIQNNLNQLVFYHSCTAISNTTCSLSQLYSKIQYNLFSITVIQQDPIQLVLYHSCTARSNTTSSLSQFYSKIQYNLLKTGNHHFFRLDSCFLPVCLTVSKALMSFNPFPRFDLITPYSLVSMDT